MKTLYEVFNPVTSEQEYGIFTALTDYGYPWITNDTDLDYLWNHAGSKTISPLVDRLLMSRNIEDFDSPDMMGVMDNLAKILHARYNATWTKLYNVLSAEYNPIQNYDMTETDTPNITRTQVETQKADVTVTSSGSNSADVFGFNSAEPVPQAESKGDTTQRTQGNAEDNVTDRTDTETGTRTLTRSGNIGVTTSQQMLESEIELWKWSFFETVFRDVDAILASPIYDI